MEWWQILLTALGGAALLLVPSIVFYKQFFKRFWDVVLSGFAIVVLLPLLLILTVVGAIAMRGNPFFTQKRPGKKGKDGVERIFKLIKFRTMSNKKDADGNLLPDKDRLNTYGNFLRSTSLDELPELFNIFVGQMSIVGPRPQLVKDMLFMTEEQRRRHDMRPGLSGLAQVSGRNAVTWEEKLDWDLKYSEKVSFLGDVKILFETVVVVFKRSGITDGENATAFDYGDVLLREGKVSKEEYDAEQAKAKNLIEGHNKK